MAKAKDLFSQRAAYHFELSAGAGVYVDSVKIPSAYNAIDKIGLVIEKMQFDLQKSTLYGIADGNALAFGLSFVPGSIDWLENYSEPGIITVQRVGKHKDAGSATDFLIHHTFKDDFTSLSGGGILVHPQALYVWMMDEGGGGDGINGDIQLQYHYVDLSDELYRELWESRLLAQGLG